ncbi:hypothetical protein KFU94_70590, partial [Chloroflexi bacterium TSY]|nr:hypothetical protein [Chloroflexi bacterium TSY]
RAGFTFDSEWQQQPLIPDGPASYSSLAADIRINLDDVPEAIPVLRIRRGIASEAENIEGEESISENIDEDLSQNSETGGEDDEQTPRTATIAIRSLGEGLVWHLSPRHGFTNNELRDRDEAKLLPALLRTVSEGDVILFDTYHLFGSSNRVQRGEIRTIGEWLYKTATGWATLFGSGAIGLFLLLQGWRLGPALPMTTGTRRREAAEYVEEKPSLQRRTQQRTAVAHYQKHRLKVALARSYHIQTNLDDQRFIERLMNSPHRFDHQQLTMIQQLLEHLDRNPDEASLVKMVREIDGIVKP